MTVDKLFPVNPRVITSPPKMSLLLEAKSTPALIIRSRLILIVAHKDDHCSYMTSNQQGQMFIKNFNRIASKPNVTYARADPVLLHMPTVKLIKHKTHKCTVVKIGNQQHQYVN